MSTDGFIGLTADEAIKTLVPAIKEAAERLKRYGENPLNWLVIKPGWEELAKDKWPRNYETRIGNIILTYAVEDRTGSGNQFRFRARVLTVSYIDVKDAELQSSVNSSVGLSVPFILPNKRMQVPEPVARTIANGFFLGPVEQRQHGETGDWVFIQLFDREEPKRVVPYASLPVPS